MNSENDTSLGQIGATKPGKVERPALLIIDLCQDFFREGRLKAFRTTICAATNNLVRFFRDTKNPIIWVRQEFEPDLSDSFLQMRRTGTPITIKGTIGAQLLPELEFSPSDIEVVKKRYSAFYETNLDNILQQLRPSQLIVAGVNTHACVRTTAVDAYQRDITVSFADEAVNSYDRAFHEESKRYMDGRIGNFVSNTRIFEMLTDLRTNACMTSDGLGQMTTNRNLQNES